MIRSIFPIEGTHKNGERIKFVVKGRKGEVQSRPLQQRERKKEAAKSDSGGRTSTFQRG